MKSRIDGLQSVHIVGVAGSATSGLACILDARGIEVTGTDQSNPSALAHLQNRGIRVCTGHAERNLGPRVDLVIHSAAVPGDNPELGAARARGIPVVKYCDVLGELLAERRGIVVAGTHGKTSTAGMLSTVFVGAGRDPSLLIGGVHPRIGANWRFGRGEEFIAEACEFDRSFHSLRARAGVITNMELDHPDIYPDEGALTAAFQEFVARFPSRALLVINGDDRCLRRIEPPSDLDVVTFGFGPDCDWRARLLEGGARPSFEVLRRGQPVERVSLRVPGRHSVANALAAFALASELGLSSEAVREGLEDFPGITRRFQAWDQVAGVQVIDDYAHHPTEVASTLDTVRDVYPSRPVWAVFQPHQYTRLDAFSAGFEEALCTADEILLLPVYSVRESPELFRSDLLANLEAGIRRRGTPVRSVDSLAEAGTFLQAHLREGDVCIALGAGDVFRLTEDLRQRLSASNVADPKRAAIEKGSRDSRGGNACLRSEEIVS